MEFTWRHVIILAEKMFFLSDEDVANRLKVNRSTIYRHKKEENNRKFRVSFDVYKALFEPPDKKPETLKDYLTRLKETLNEDTFPADIRNLGINEYEQYIRCLLQLAEKANKTVKPMRTPEIDSPDSSEHSVATDSVAVDAPMETVQSVWDPEPVFMPEEFYKCFNKYAIADFIELDPMDLILINYMVAKKRPDGEGLIRSAIQFVKVIENAMQHAEISFWNEKVCKAISAFTRSLREYIDFLMKNAESPDFTTSPFLLNPTDADEFERKEIWYRKKMQSIYGQITDVESRWHGLQMYAYFPGQ